MRQLFLVFEDLILPKSPTVLFPLPWFLRLNRPLNKWSPHHFPENPWSWTHKVPVGLGHSLFHKILFLFSSLESKSNQKSKSPQFHRCNPAIPCWLKCISGHPLPMQSDWLHWQYPAGESSSWLDYRGEMIGNKHSRNHKNIPTNPRAVQKTELDYQKPPEFLQQFLARHR